MLADRTYNIKKISHSDIIFKTIAVVNNNQEKNRSTNEFDQMKEHEITLLL